MIENCEMSIRGEVLTITIRLDVSGRPSQKRHLKNRVLSTTGGTQPLIGENGRYRQEKINLSVWRPATNQELAEESHPYGMKW